MCFLNLKCVFLCHRCWLSVDNHFIWSFIGPVTFIIMVSCFIFLWILRLTEWGRDREGEMKQMPRRDKGSEMVELKEKSAGFFFFSTLLSDDRLILWQRQISRLFLQFSLPLASWQGSAFGCVLFMYLRNSQEVSHCRHCQMALRVTLFVIKGEKNRLKMASRLNFSAHTVRWHC